MCFSTKQPLISKICMIKVNDRTVALCRKYIIRLIHEGSCSFQLFLIIPAVSGCAKQCTHCSTCADPYRNYFFHIARNHTRKMPKKTNACFQIHKGKRRFSASFFIDIFRTASAAAAGHIYETSIQKILSRTSEIVQLERLRFMVSGKSIFKNNRNCPCVKSIFINLSCQFTALSQKMLRYINIHTLFRRYLRVPAVCSPLPQIAMMLFQIFPWDFSRVIAKSLLCCRVHSVILPFLYYSPVLFFYVIFLCYFSALLFCTLCL